MAGVVDNEQRTWLSLSAHEVRQMLKGLLLRMSLAVHELGLYIEMVFVLHRFLQSGKLVIVSIVI
jgi:hypothetical protein